ncbi:hypothetical protein PENTCL1PPCAC_27705 [Pristionchus entomophagus]|uniref:Transmembrane 9 superfamily member n=1 Tax=Pristionchus entomophagus TaxID=358040 RepID=A0AAV5UEW8_9BILA|nr:hypothetical protein PENTCL1PPCAC_27705 [Pristionchus entomophagus]
MVSVGMLLLTAAAASVCCTATAYGEYEKNDKLPVYVNKVGPYDNPHETYHYYSLPLCRPEKIIHHSLSLGQVLDGDRMADSAFEIKFNQPTTFRSLCGKQRLTGADATALAEAIEKSYYAELIIDDLKVHHFLGSVQEAAVFPHEHRVFLYTHYEFEVEHNEGHVISVHLRMNRSSMLELLHNTEAAVDIGYSVVWRRTSTPVGSRSLSSSRSSSSSTFFAASQAGAVHWLSIANSLLLVTVLVVTVGIIVASAVKRDLSRYNKMGGEEERDDYDDMALDNGWKTVAGDVFRPPAYPMALSAVLGSGSQLLTLAAALLIIGTTEVVAVHNHGLLHSLCVVIYALTSGVAGYVSSHKYQELDGKRWIANINVTSLVFVAPLAAAWAFSNTVAWMYGSTQALPWTTVVALVAIWALVGYPLTVIGGLLGRSVRAARGSSAPFRTRTIARELPRESCTRRTPMQAMLGGLLPFSAIAVELSYIYSTMWGRETYTLYGVIAIVCCILVVVTACCSIGLTYMQLAAENYHWWWRSTLIGGSISVYMFVYGVAFLLHSTSMRGTLQLTEFATHLGLLCYATALACGTISHVAAATFVQYIYSSVKSD